MSSIIRSPRIGRNSRMLATRQIASLDLTKSQSSQEPDLHSTQSQPPVDTGASVKVAPTQDSMPDVSAASIPSPQERELQSARQRIDELKTELAELRAGLDELREDSRKEGYDSGLQKGEQAAKSNYAEGLATLADIVGSAKQQSKQLIENAQDDMVELVFATVLKVFGELAPSKEGLLAMLQLTADEMSTHKTSIVRVARDDYERLKTDFDEVAAIFRDQDIRVVPDGSVDLGGCIVEAESGSLDASLETQLMRFKELLLQVRKQQRNNCVEK